MAERLLKASREIRPQTVRGFFAPASRHARWEWNDLALRLDDREILLDVHAIDAAAPERGGSSVGAVAGRMLGSTEALPDDECEVLELVRMHGLTHGEAAEVLGLSTKNVRRRLDRALRSLADSLPDLPSP